MKNEPVRTFPQSVVTARCIDCAREFTGPLGVRFIEPPREDPGVEIVIADEEHHEIHSIARVERHLVPTVKTVAIWLSTQGKA